MPDELANVVAFTIQESSSSNLNERTGQVTFINVASLTLQILGGNSSDKAMLSFVSGLKTVDASEIEVLETVLFNSMRKFSATHVKSYLNSLINRELGTIGTFGYQKIPLYPR